MGLVRLVGLVGLVGLAELVAISKDHLRLAEFVELGGISEISWISVKLQGLLGIIVICWDLQELVGISRKYQGLAMQSGHKYLELINLWQIWKKVTCVIYAQYRIDPSAS